MTGFNTKVTPEIESLTQMCVQIIPAWMCHFMESTM